MDKGCEPRRQTLGVNWSHAHPSRWIPTHLDPTPQNATGIGVSRRRSPPWLPCTRAHTRVPAPKNYGHAFFPEMVSMSSKTRLSPSCTKRRAAPSPQGRGVSRPWALKERNVDGAVGSPLLRALHRAVRGAGFPGPDSGSQSSLDRDGGLVSHGAAAGGLPGLHPSGGCRRGGCAAGVAGAHDGHRALLLSVAVS